NYLWSNAETSASISNLQAGLYSLTVYDNFGCQQIQSYELGQPDKLEISLDIKDISCFGDNDGGVKISATGGTQPYLYELAIEDSIYIGQMHAPLSTGTYVAYVRDMNSCIDTALFMLISPAPLEATYVFESPSCFGARDGYIEFSVAGGVEPYLFETNNAIVDIPLLSGLSAGNYTVIITDAHDCSLEFKGIILSESDIDCIRIPNAFTPNGDGINDTWIIENLLMFSGARIYVYNRWGQEIWVGYPGDEWDGKYNSKLMPATTYLYVIELYDGSKPYTGTVTIIY
ncbi:MAG TPA: gliding motility-associated C-terminal domain-containing protein, partial [Bacteroidales bacterium]|nr:gliding motility-associated C-terminal domain-containing protein [Bacteroidales bacterium]